MNVVAVDEPIANAGSAPFAEVGFTESCAHGVVEPTPSFPVDESKYKSFPAVPNATVEDAYNPDCAHKGEVVAEASVEPYVAEWLHASYEVSPVPEMVMGDAPIAVKEVQDAVPEHETVVVATPSWVELPQYVRYPAAVVVVPVPPFAMPRVPVTPVESGSPVPFVSVIADGVPRFGVVNVGDVSRTTEPVPLQVKSDEVATAVTFPVAPVELPKIEFAAICARFVRETPFVARDSVPAEPPTSAPNVPECEKAPESDKEVVATDDTPAAPFVE
jgi:hypothetical protein